MARLRQLAGRPRCIYAKNPLAEVIAAVKFPPELRIEEQLPIEFQGKVKTDFPLLELKSVVSLLGATVSGESAGANRPLALSKNFDFVSEDKTRRVSVAADLFALTTTTYTRWEDFLSRFDHVFASFSSVYNPQLFSRLGLRYRDIIDRAAIGISEATPWDRLINADLLKPFTLFSEGLADNPHYTAAINLEVDEAALTIAFGFVQGAVDKKVAFLIDTDCYVDPARLRTGAEVRSTLEVLHKYTSLAFGSAITDELHAALQPTEP